MQITEGAEPIRDCSQRVRMEDISSGINTFPSANLHFGYLCNKAVNIVNARKKEKIKTFSNI